MRKPHPLYMWDLQRARATAASEERQAHREGREGKS